MFWFLGFMCGTSVLDKDGVSAAVVIAEMAAYLDTKSQTLAHQLMEIYKTYVLSFTFRGHVWSSIG